MASADQTRWAGPLELYPPPWWWGVPPQRKRGPSYRLTPQQVRKLIEQVEYWLKRPPSSEWSLEAADSGDLIEQIRQGGWISTFDGEMPQADSEDSYNTFARRNPHMVLSMAELAAREPKSRYGHRSASEQIAWEAEQRARREAKEAESGVLWDNETIRRGKEASLRAFWHRKSKRFIDQPFVRVRVGHEGINVRDEEDTSWSVRFNPRETYTVPEEVADLMVRLGSSRQ